jgi:ElaB/YqjD/DUF883 family membrane-anchored ribosome-binding protein
MGGEMMEDLKEQLKEILERLDEIEDHLEERAEQLPEEVKKLWYSTQSQLSRFGDKLTLASREAEGAAEHLALQAHLATREAHDHWQQLQQAVQHLLKSSGAELTTELEHAKVQAHLAEMEAKDYLAETEKVVTRDYQSARKELEETTLKLATQLKEAFDGIIAGLPK